MYYIHYNEDGEITAVANHNNDAEFYIEASKLLFDSFQSGRYHFHEYRVIEDVYTKGKMHVVPIVFDNEEHIKHKTGKIELADDCDNGIQIVQDNNSWIVNNFIDYFTLTRLSISEEDYIKEYYIVDGNNRFILLDKFSLNIKDISMRKQTMIPNTIKNKKISIITRSSHIPHVHTVGKI
tara:strand:+ start:190 stop:729 length:540 start_codon:yes stop_codon:yes gene_type:complete